MLTLHEREQRLGKRVLLERLAIAGHRGVLATLAFFEHGLVTEAHQRAAYSDPAAVQCAAGAAALVRFAAVLDHIRLQFGRSDTAFVGALQEDIAQLAGRGVLRASGKAELAVLAGFDEIIQRVDNVVVGHGGVLSMQGTWVMKK